MPTNRLITGLVAVLTALCLLGIVTGAVAADVTLTFKATDGTNEELLFTDTYPENTMVTLPSVPEDTAERLYSQIWFDSSDTPLTGGYLLTDWGDCTVYVKYCDPTKPFRLYDYSTGNITAYTTFEDAWENAESDNTIYVHADVTFPNQFVFDKVVGISDENYHPKVKPVLDFQGGISLTADNTVNTSNLAIRLGAPLTCTDSSNDWSSYNTDYVMEDNFALPSCLFDMTKGCLRFEGCTFTAPSIVHVSGSTDDDSPSILMLDCKLKVSDTVLDSESRSEYYFTNVDIVSEGSVAKTMYRTNITMYGNINVVCTGDEPVFHAISAGDTEYTYGIEIEKDTDIKAKGDIFQMDSGASMSMTVRGKYQTEKSFAILDGAWLSMYSCNVTCTGDAPVIVNNDNNASNVGLLVNYSTISAPECTGYAIILHGCIYNEFMLTNINVPKGSGILAVPPSGNFTLNMYGDEYGDGFSGYFNTKGKTFDIKTSDTLDSFSVNISGYSFKSTDDNCFVITAEEGVTPIEPSITLTNAFSSPEGKESIIMPYEKIFEDGSYFTSIDDKYIRDGYCKFLSVYMEGYYGISQSSNLTLYYPDQTVTIKVPSYYTYNYYLPKSDWKGEGKIMKGWDESSPATQVVIPDGGIVRYNSGVSELYAYVVDGYRTVTYVADGEPYGEVDNESVKFVVDVRPLPEKEGYTYSAWTSDDVTVENGQFVMPDKDIVFTSTSTPNTYTTSYYVDDELYGAEEEHTYGDEVTVRDLPTATGFTYPAWTSEEVTVTEGKYVMPASDVRFDTSKDANKFKSVYRLNGVQYDTESHKYQDIVNLKDSLSRGGYHITDWDSDQTTITDRKYEMPYNNVTFSATMTLGEYSISYDTDGGSIVGDYPSTYTYGDSVKLPSSVVKDGYNFNGWYDNPALEGSPVYYIEAGDYGNKHFYASWVDKSVTPTRMKSSSTSVTSFFGEIDGNVVTFPNSPVVTKMIIPDVKKATIIKNSDSWYGFNLITDACYYEGSVIFQIPAEVLSVKDKTVNDVILTTGGKTMKTEYIGNDDRYEVFKAELKGDGKYVITFDGNGLTQKSTTSTINDYRAVQVVETVKETIKENIIEETPAVTQKPVTVTTTKVNTVTVSTPTIKKNTATSPFPILAVLGGLAVGGFLLMRKKE